MTVEEKKQWIDKKQKGLSVAAQLPISESELRLMRRVDEIYTAWPFYVSRRITQELKKEGYDISRKRVQRVMRNLGIASNQPGPNTSKPHPQHIKFPYLLNGLLLLSPREVWSIDITYMRLPHVYLVAVIDWFSRLVLSHRLSNSLETSFCLEAFEEAIECHGCPNIFNTNQGAQFTFKEFGNAVLGKNIRFSMDRRGRALDNVFVERLWRSVKYENVYLQDYQNVSEARVGLENYFQFYNTQRPHQSLEYKTSYKVHYAIAN